MSRRAKKLVVSNYFLHQGIVGTVIEDCLSRKRDKIKKNYERRKELGKIADEDLILEDYPELKNLDPKDYKDQDHYAVLGLQKLRYRATQDHIKLAYRKMVLKHHPDKRRRAGETIGDETSDYFGCITQAYEQLGTLESRRAYDSIDPDFDDSIPPANKHARENFYFVFTPVFERNARWSLEPHVPFLGDETSTIDEVDRFYNFWYNFNSWREFSYLDEENKQKAEDAYERRWMEKQNRAARATRKKEENQRLRQLVDNSYACDPRIKYYKEEEKRKKEEGKAARAEAARLANEQKLAEEKERKVREEEEEQRLQEEKRQQQAEAKREKDREKKATKKERQKLQQFCKTHNYFTESDEDRLTTMDRINHLCVWLDLISLRDLNKSIEQSSKPNEGWKSIQVQLDQLRDEVENEKRKHLDSAAASKCVTSNGASEKSSKAWSYDDLQLLIKAVNVFPAGTNSRWDVVAGYVNSRGRGGVQRTGKECLARAKNLKESELKQEANQKAFEKFQEKHLAGDRHQAAPKNNEITERFETKGADVATAAKSWTGDEQKRLEQALKTYPNSTPQRWDRISEALPDRTKKECMQRYKELVEMVKAKKAINQKAGSNK